MQIEVLGAHFLLFTVSAARSEVRLIPHNTNTTSYSLLLLKS